MAMEFYNPYQFIPVKKVSEQLTAFEAIKSKKIHIRHDLWKAGTLSGRVICSLTTKTPVMIGSQRHDADDKKLATRYDNYTVYDQAQQGPIVAIPANSLRGMIASVMEAISLSSMRVLNDSRYSVRKPMREALKAIGKIKQNDDGSFQIIPLALVSAPINNTKIQFEKKWVKCFANSPLTQCLAGYIGSYLEDDAKEKQSIAGIKLEDLYSYDDNLPNYVYAQLNTKLHDIPVQEALNLSTVKDSVYVKTRWNRNKNKNEDVLVNQKLAFSDPINNDEYQQLPESQRASYTRGVLYVLGEPENKFKAEDKQKQLMPTKKHDLFIPYSEEQISQRAPIKLPGKVVKQFEDIANERYLASDKNEEKNVRFPLLPRGKCPEKNPNGKNNFRFIANGDLVYFDINNDADEVTEISYSSIWRQQVDTTTHQYFLRNAHQEDGENINILPWGAQKRDSLTPAEALLGVVEANPDKSQESRRNLASRLRFHDALPHEENVRLEKAQTLKILGSPKPPSPILYFHKAPLTPISKSQLENDGVLPNGRKHYLHHPEDQVYRKQWNSNDAKKYANQKVICSPISVGQEFTFHIDFDNLTEDEFNLLLSSLEPNRNEYCSSESRFWHKIGLGKPLGLGSIDLQLHSYYLVDRSRRYGEEMMSEQHRYYHSVLMSKAKIPEILMGRYPNELDNNRDNKGITENAFKSNLVDQDAIQTLFTLGCRDLLQAGIPVCYPFTNEQSANSEEEIYKWFAQKSIDRKKTIGPSKPGHIPKLNAGTKVKHETTQQTTKGDNRKQAIYIVNIPKLKPAEIPQWEQQIQEAMQKRYGGKVTVDLPNKCSNGRDTCYGFIDMPDDTACKAIEDKILKINHCVIKILRNKQKR